MMRAFCTGLLFVCAAAAQPTLLMTLENSAPADSVLFSNSGTIAAAVCGDHNLRVWDLPEGRLTAEISLGDRMIYTSAISGDGAWIAAADFAGLYTVWNAATGAHQIEFQLSSYPFSLRFSPEGNWLAAAPAEDPVAIYDVQSGRKVLELQPVIGGSQSLAFSRDGRRLATADSDTVVRIYDTANGEVVTRYTGFLMEPLAASFTPDGDRLLTAGGDKVIVVLDVATGSTVRQSAKLVDPVQYLEVSPDGALTAVGLMHADNLMMPAPLLISETESGQLVQEWMPTSMILGRRWTDDGRLLAATNAEEGLQVWRVR